MEPETKSVTDIAKIKTDEGRSHLIIAPDLRDHRIVDWSTYHREDRQTAIRAVQLLARQN